MSVLSHNVLEEKGMLRSEGIDEVKDLSFERILKPEFI